MTGYCLGVDLGTSYTAAAIYRDGRLEMLNLGNRTAEIPSVGYLGPAGVLEIGESAERRAMTDPRRVVRDFKRRIGDPTPILLGGAPFAPEALMAALLESVLAAAEQQQGAPPGTVVLTHPANWGAYKRELFGQVPTLAGLGTVGTATEPEAAAVHFASTTRVRVGELVAVYDLGGGTFDAAVLRKIEGGFELLGKPEGIEHLGGADFDDAVVAHVRDALGELTGPDGSGPLDGADSTDGGRAAAARLRQDCVQAKENLSYDNEATIAVILPGVHTEVRLTRAEFEEMIGPAVDATVRALGRAIRSAGVEPDRISTVLLAGGSSRIPLISQRIIERLQIPVAVSGHPKHSVALGAAYLAATVGATGHPDRTVVTPPPPPTAAREAGAAAGRRRRITPGRRGWLAVGAVVAAVVLAVVAAVVVRGSGGDRAATTPTATIPTATTPTATTPTTGSSSSVATSGATRNDSASAGSAADPARWCQTLTGAFGDIRGTSVRLVTSSAADEMAAAFRPWERCTGAKVQVSTNTGANLELPTLVQSDDPPDLVAGVGPATVTDLVREGKPVQPLPALAQQNLHAFYAGPWSDLLSVDGAVYAVPGDVTVKSLVWYSPTRFAARGYQVPTTSEQLVALTDRIAADGGTPWCLGIEDGQATGWPLTDWLEDIVLRQAGPDTYDRWVTHAVGFSSQPISDALAALGGLVEDDRYLAGGRQGSSEATWSDDAKRLAAGDCEMVHQGGFLGTAGLFPDGTSIGPGKDIHAFYLPAAAGADTHPVLGGGDVIAQLTDRAETASALTYLTYPIYADTRMTAGPFLSPNFKADATGLQDPILRLEDKILSDPHSVLRFDASDLMPPEVGADAEWRQLTAWLRDGQDEATTLANIDAAWPS